MLRVRHSTERSGTAKAGSLKARRTVVDGIANGSGAARGDAERGTLLMTQHGVARCITTATELNVEEASRMLAALKKCQEQIQWYEQSGWQTVIPFLNPIIAVPSPDPPV